MTTPVREQLLASSDEFRKLLQEHQTYSQQLDNLSQKPYLSEDDKLEAIRLKKLKLHAKDQIHHMEQNFLRGRSETVA